MKHTTLVDDLPNVFFSCMFHHFPVSGWIASAVPWVHIQKQKQRLQGGTCSKNQGPKVSKDSIQVLFINSNKFPRIQSRGYRSAELKPFANESIEWNPRYSFSPLNRWMFTFSAPCHHSEPSSRSKLRLCRKGHHHSLENVLPWFQRVQLMLPTLQAQQMRGPTCEKPVPSWQRRRGNNWIPPKRSCLKD